MGKRSDFERNPRDYYRTPTKAIEPLIPFLPDVFTYVEPNAGDGALINGIRHLTGDKGKCVFASDIEPQQEWILKKDAFELTKDETNGADLIIGNPPWERKLLHPMIEHFSHIAPTWLLFDSDWLWTKQARGYMRDYLICTVAVGRVKWIEGSKMTGKDNCQWALFSSNARNIIQAPFLFGDSIAPPALFKEIVYENYQLPTPIPRT